MRYQNNRRSNFRGNHMPRGPRPIKSFDPSTVIQNQVNTPKEELVIYNCIHTFNDLDIEERLKRNISNLDYNSPTPIQDQAIPHILEGLDLIGIANTGTGKTAAFLIPLINKVLKNRYEKVLIVAPTRELASQIKDDFSALAKNLGINSVLCIGGGRMHMQKSDLKRPFNFIIGTPGRIQDLVKQKCINLSIFQTVVLDEADHMVDIGFIDTIKSIISFLHNKRQSLFFSATIDGKVKEILRDFVKSPVTVSVKVQDTAENVVQEIVKIFGPHTKTDRLHDLLIQKDFEKVLIFGRTKWGVQKLSDELYKRGFKTGAIHGNKRQNQRQRVLDAFKRDEIRILLATDVASRGLDIPNVSHVINYDLPESYDAYIHRIGRTGRADKKGTALTFVEQK